MIIDIRTCSGGELEIAMAQANWRRGWTVRQEQVELLEQFGVFGEVLRAEESASRPKEKHWCVWALRRKKSTLLGVEPCYGPSRSLAAKAYVRQVWMGLHASFLCG